MATTTFETIHAQVAAFHAREAANAAPLAVACRALDALRESLAMMRDADHDEIIDGMRELVAEQDAQSWQTFNAIAPRDHECKPRTTAGRLKTRR